MNDMPQYIYHSEKNNKFFGRYSNLTKDVEFEDNKVYEVRNITTPGGATRKHHKRR